MSFENEHAGALETLRENGAAITFTYESLQYDPATQAKTLTSSAVSGYALRVGGNPRTYSELGLVETEAPTLMFVSSTYGDVPRVGSECTWRGEKYKVSAVDRLEPDGVTIFSRVVISQ